MDTPSFLVVAWLIAFLQVTRSLGIYCEQRKRRQDMSPTRCLPRVDRRYVSAMLQHQVILLAAILASFMTGFLQPNNVRLFGSIPWHLSFVFGAGVYCLLIYTIDFTRLPFQQEDPFESLEKTYLSLRVHIPRGRQTQAENIIATGLINPITEEVLYRGILVYYTGTYIGNTSATIVTGLAMCLLVHIYQGPRHIPFHTMFYAIAVGLMFSPCGLIGAIGFHFMGDIVPFQAFRRTLANYRLARRGQRTMNCTAKSGMQQSE